MRQSDELFGTFFSLSHYAVHHFHIPGNSLCDKRSGRATASLYYITEGKTVFITPSGNQEVSSGELLYIPRRQRYTATWTGEPDIDFYGIDFGFELKSEFGAIPGNTGLYDSFILQKPQIGADIGLSETFERLYTLYSDPENTGLAAVMAFYAFFEKLLPALDKTTERINDNAAEKAAVYIEEHCTEDFYAEELAELCGLSPSGFYTAFKKYTGLTPVEYKNNARVRLAQKMIEQNKSAEEIAETLNFSSPAYFRKVFRNVTGMLPGVYKKNASGYKKK